MNFAQHEFVKAREDDRGSVSAELVLLTPMLIILLLFVVFCGRVAQTAVRLNDVAHQSARAASLARTPAQSVGAAQSTASAALESAGVTCQSTAITASTQGMRSESAVTVTVICVVSLADLALLGVGGTRTFEASFTSPIDPYRSAPSDIG